MSSALAAIPMGSGAPNAIRGRDRAPSVQATGNPAASIAATQPSATSRCASSGAAAERATTRRQRWRGSAVLAGRSDTSGSLPDDGRARTVAGRP